MDAMPEKVLIKDELIDEDGNCCTIGVVCKLRGVPVEGVITAIQSQLGISLASPSRWRRRLSTRTTNAATGTNVFRNASVEACERNARRTLAANAKVG